MKWRFYINNTEVHEPSNWTDISSKWSRNTDYWGLFEGAFLDEVIFQQFVTRTIASGYDLLNQLWNDEGVNAEASLRVDKWDELEGVWETEQVYDMDFSEFSQVLDRELGLAVKIAVNSSDLWKLIKQRESQNLIIGREVDVMGNAIEGVPSDMVLYRNLPLALKAEKESAYDETMDGLSQATFIKWWLTPDTHTSLGNLNDLEFIIPLKNIKKNIDWVNNTSFNKIKRSLPNLYQQTVINFNFPPPVVITTDSHYAFEPFNILISKTLKDFEVVLEFDIELQANYQNTGNRFIYLVEADWDGAGISNLDRIQTFTKNVTLGDKTENFTGSFTFTKRFNKIYYLAFATANGTAVVIKNYSSFNFNPIDLGFIKADVTIETFDISEDSTHKSYSLQNCLMSLLRQMTGVNDVLESPLFSEVLPLNYCDDLNEVIDTSDTLVKLKDIYIPFSVTASVEIKLTSPTTEGLIFYFANVDNPDSVIAGNTILTPDTEFELINLVGNIPQGNYSIYVANATESGTQGIDIEIRNLCFSPNLAFKTFDKIFFTNGQFLRNAETIDGEPPQLTMNFRDLWQTLKAQYNVGLMLIGNKLLIDYRSNLFGSEEIPIEINKLTISNEQRLYHTGVKVGNKRINYEFQNGTEEPNTELEFSLNMRVKDSDLDLVTKAHTDYLAVELARRVNFQVEATTDTRYDKMIAMTFCEFVGGIIRTKRYTDFSNYVFPDFMYNLEFSPKRALLRNGDLLRTALYKNDNGVVRFEKIENMANLISEGITERDDVEKSELIPSIVDPIIYDVEVGEKYLSYLIKNKNALFIFTFKGQEYKGYLWNAELKQDIGQIKLLKANED